MTTRREAAAVRWADLLLADNAAVDDWNATGRMYQEVRDAEAAYRATLAEPAPALDPLTAATVAKMRAKADALERGEVPAGVAFQVHGAGAECDREDLASAAAYADEVLDDLRDEARGGEWSDEAGDLCVEVVIALQAAHVVDRRCAKGSGYDETWDYALIDPDAWTEPELDPCDDPDCSNCGCGGGLVQCN